MLCGKPQRTELPERRDALGFVVEHEHEHEHDTNTNTVWL